MFKLVQHQELHRRIADGELTKYLCQKTAPIFIRPGIVGEKVITLVQKPSNSDTPLIEETSCEVLDTKAMVVVQFIDGRPNCYIVHRGVEEIERKYNKTEDRNGALEKWVPKPTESKVAYLVEENLEFSFPPSWGQEGLFRLLKGGVIVDNGDGCFYGINPLEFRATHKVLEITPAALL